MWMRSPHQHITIQMGLLLFYAFLAIFFSFLCSILEAAFLSYTPSFLKMKDKEGERYAKEITHLKQNVDEPLIAILTVNTIAHTVGALMVGIQAEKIFPEGGKAIGLVSALMTLAILILSEIIPKTIGATYWKSLGRFTATALRILILPLKYTGILHLMMLTTRVVGKSAHVNNLSREEFLAITESAEEEGVFEEKESTFIKNMLLFGSVRSKDIMTPFSVAVTENEKTTIEEFHRNHKNLKFSRIPVYEEVPNNISGFILKDDVLERMLDAQGSQPLSSIKREIHITSADTPIPKLFENFLAKRTHLGIVVDSFGNTIGLLSMEDIIETLLGYEIMDESDNIEDMQVLARKKWRKRARKLGIIDETSENEDW